MIAVDIETLDPGLHTLGDGSIRGDGAILCVGLYDGIDAVCVTPDDPRLREWLASEEDKIFHNGVYDLSWLICGYGFNVGGKWHDTMTRAGLVDENMPLDLDSCCKKFKVTGKNADDTIEQWWEDNKRQFELRGKLWDHADVLWMTTTGRDAMTRYNIQDVKATYNLFKAQEPYITGTVLDAYKMETDLYPLLIQMKKTGIRIDEVARDRLTEHVTNDLKEVESRLKAVYGIDREIIASPKKLSAAMALLDIRSPVQTATGGQSWAADVLDLIDHPVIPMIQQVKNDSALLDKYLMGAFVKMPIKGRMHPTFSPNKRDEGGTVTGRFSCKTPNMQQVTARTEKHGQKTYGQEMRSLFLPEEGYMLAAADYSAIEAVLLAHYAAGNQAEWFRDQIRSGIDFHTSAQQMTGIESRDVIKRMNYGFIYGMGIGKLVSTNRLLFKKLAGSEDINIYGKRLYDQYHARLPVIKDTMRAIQNEAKVAGYVTTLGGRQLHKPNPVFEDGRWNDGIYKMTNKQIQGSAADVLKRGLLDAYNAGIFDTLVMHLTVHDENVVSVPYNKIGTEAINEFLHIMVSPYKDILRVPLKVACDLGPTWGTWSDEILKEMQNGTFRSAT